MAAGRSVFYTDLPDLDACILLYGLFFNLFCSSVQCETGVFMGCVGNVSQECGEEKISVDLDYIFKI